MSLLKVLLTSLMIYLYLSVLLRLFGKKEFSQLNVFDFVVFLIIAEIITETMGNPDFTFLHGIVATATLIIVDRLVTLITMRSKKIRDILEGKPNYIIYDGKINQQRMKELRYSVDDLCHHLRVNDVDSISKVAFAMLETNGSLSVIKKQDCTVKLPDSLIFDGVVDEDNLRFLNRDINWLIKELKKQKIDKVEDVFYCVLENDRLLVVKK